MKNKRLEYDLVEATELEEETFQFDQDFIRQLTGSARSSKVHALSDESEYYQLGD